MLNLVVGYLSFSEACYTEVLGNSLSFSWALMEVADGMRWWKQHSGEFLVCPWFLLLQETSPHSCEEIYVGSSPTVQIIPCWGTFHGTVGALKSVRIVRQFILQQAKIFFFLVAVYGTKLKAGGKWRRTAECGWALLDFLRFSLLLCFFVLFFVFPIPDSFLGMFQNNKKSKIDESQRNGIHLVLRAQLIYVEEGCSQKPWGKNSLLNSYMLWRNLWECFS